MCRVEKGLTSVVFPQVLPGCCLHVEHVLLIICSYTTVKLSSPILQYSNTPTLQHSNYPIFLYLSTLLNSPENKPSVPTLSVYMTSIFPKTYSPRAKNLYEFRFSGHSRDCATEAQRTQMKKNETFPGLCGSMASIRSRKREFHGNYQRTKNFSLHSSLPSVNCLPVRFFLN